MPDLGMPAAAPPRPASHTATHEWQSFEMRMRRRRAERCVVRAEVALDAGFEEDARRVSRSGLPESRRFASSSAARRRAERLRRAAGVAAAALVVALGAAVMMLRDDAPAAPGVVEASPPALVETSAAGTTGVVASVTEPALAVDPGLAAATERSTTVADAGDAAGAATETAPREAARIDVPARDAIQRDGGSAAPDAAPVKRPSALDTPAAIPQPLPRVADAPARTLAPPLSTVDAVRPAAGSGSPPVAAPAVSETPVLDLPGTPAAAPPPPALAAPSAEPQVRAVLARYEAAYSNLDAGAAQAVWPSVDGRSLTRAFDGLESQHVSLGRCAITVNGASASARCNGTATWTPKVGGGTKTEAREWRFQLVNTGGAWTIVQAEAR